MQLILQFNTERMSDPKIELLITRITDIAEDVADELDGELVYDFVDYEEDNGDGMFWPQPEEDEGDEEALRAKGLVVDDDDIEDDGLEGRDEGGEADSVLGD